MLFRSLPLSSPNFEYGPPSIEAVEVARIVDRGIRESGFIDFKKLNIKEGEKVWSIFIDLATINDDGNLIDASALAAVLALMTARMPEYDEKLERVKFGEFTDKKLPLVEDKMPLTTTFFKIGEKIFVDGFAHYQLVLNQDKQIRISSLDFVWDSPKIIKKEYTRL